MRRAGIDLGDNALDVTAAMMELLIERPPKFGLHVVHMPGLPSVFVDGYTLSASGFGDNVRYLLHIRGETGLVGKTEALRKV